MSEAKAASTPSQAKLISLFPFVIFLALFLGTGTILSLQGADYAFYQLPASIAIIPAIVIAFLVGKESFEEQISTFIKGVGNANIITMCLIYLLAGAFATVAKASGSVDATVSAGLQLFPPFLLLPGLFLVAAFLSTAMGTSMGTIAAIAPIALGISQSADIDASLVAGVVISGAMFGDNLSIISDTTIASTRTQGARMKDKFKVNFFIAVPAALICLVLFYFLGESYQITQTTDYNLLSLIPYVLILVLALSGVNVFLVLITGVFLAAGIGFVTSDYQLGQWISDINKGFAGMQDIFILSLLIGGLSEIVKQRGGIDALTKVVNGIVQKIFHSSKKKAASAGIAFLAFVSNFFTANNTISIIFTGETAKKLSESGEIPPAKSASYLDIFACISQGLIPYGAQALLLGTSLGISPTSVVAFAFYPMILFVFGVIAIAKTR